MTAIFFKLNIIKNAECGLPLPDDRRQSWRSAQNISFADALIFFGRCLPAQSFQFLYSRPSIGYRAHLSIPFRKRLMPYNL